MVPIDFARSVCVEPEVSFQYHKDGAISGFGGFTRAATVLRPALGIFGPLFPGEDVAVNLGARHGFTAVLIQEAEDAYHFSLAPAAAAEYFVSSRFSIGVEAQLSFLFPVLVTKARAAQRKESARLGFAAQAFATAEYLWRKESSVFMPVAGAGDIMSERTADWDELPVFLGDLQAKPGYEVVKALLALIQAHERWFVERYMGALPEPSTAVEHVPDGDIVALDGTVLHWLRPPAQLGRVIRDRSNDRGFMHYRNEPRFAFEHLAFVWNQTWPRLTPITNPDPRISLPSMNAGLDDKGGGAFRVALCPVDLTGSLCWPTFQVNQDLRSFQTVPNGMQGHKQLIALLDQLLADAAEREIHLLVLPELTVDEEAVQHLSRRLAESDPTRPYPGAVIAGSMHVKAPPCVANVSPLLDDAGRELWRHRKRGRFRLPGDVIHALETAAGERLFNGTPRLYDDALLEEGIVHGTQVGLLDTRAARIAPVICADVLDFNALPPLWRGGIDLLVVPSMSPRVDDFQDWAVRLGRLRTAMAYVNAGCCLPHVPSSVAAFFYAPMAPMMQPTYVRWCPFADDVLQQYQRGSKQWTPYNIDSDSAYTLLPNSRGLVVDLAAFYREWQAAKVE